MYVVSPFRRTAVRLKPDTTGLTGRALALVADAIDIRSLPSVVVQSATVEGPERTAHVSLIDRGATPGSSLLVSAAPCSIARSSTRRWRPARASCAKEPSMS